MERCGICGREFDPFGFQVVVPELGRGFDRIECAREARAAAPTSDVGALLPLAAIVEPVPAAAAPLAVWERASRRPLVAGTNLALLAAGTAATAFLWMRVFGADPASHSLAPTSPPSAQAGETLVTQAPSVRAASDERANERARTRAADDPGQPPAAVAATTTPGADAGGGGDGDVRREAAERHEPHASPVDGNGGRGDGDGGDGERAARTATASRATTASGAQANANGRGHGKKVGHAQGKKVGHAHGKKVGHAQGKKVGHANAHSRGQGKKVGHDKHH